MAPPPSLISGLCCAFAGHGCAASSGSPCGAKVPARSHGMAWAWRGQTVQSHNGGLDVCPAGLWRRLIRGLVERWCAAGPGALRQPWGRRRIRVFPCRSAIPFFLS